MKIRILDALLIAILALPACSGDGEGTPSQCSDGARDGDETDTDCGGSCGACGTSRRCGGGRDCTSGFCTNGQCAAPSCSDGAKNGTESDLDCGGGGCPGCKAGRACLTATDCASLTCTNNVCTSQGCSDGKQDNDETDVDCGGSCAGCGPGKMCLLGTDCASGGCADNACVGGSFDLGTGSDGGSPECAPVAFLSANPSPYNFGAEPFPSSNSSQVVFTNKAGHDLTVTQATMSSNGNPPGFRITGYVPSAPPYTLSAGASFNVNIDWEATQAMVYLGMLTLTTSAGPVGVCLSGTAYDSHDGGAD